MPNSKHLTHGISNLVSLITKTKLRLSSVLVMPNKIWVPPLENGIALHMLQCRSKQGIATGPTWQIKKDQTRPTPTMATAWTELVLATKYFF
jgi:hypothetical protein